jgi:hypothetical protein
MAEVRGICRGDGLQTGQMRSLTLPGRLRQSGRSAHELFYSEQGGILIAGTKLSSFWDSPLSCGVVTNAKSHSVAFTTTQFRLFLQKSFAMRRRASL